MADEEAKEPVVGETNQNIFEILNRDKISGDERGDVNVPDDSEEVVMDVPPTDTLEKAKENPENPHVNDVKARQNSHVHFQNKHDSMHVDPPSVFIDRDRVDCASEIAENASDLSIPVSLSLCPLKSTAVTSVVSLPIREKSDLCISPESGSKRRRIQHDYRRLSSSGYLDDYEGGGRERFSAKINEPESPTTSPPKVKPLKLKVKQIVPPITVNLLNGTAQSPPPPGTSQQILAPGIESSCLLSRVNSLRRKSYWYNTSDMS
jgi:hypothetical protein